MPPRRKKQEVPEIEPESPAVVVVKVKGNDEKEKQEVTTFPLFFVKYRKYALTINPPDKKQFFGSLKRHRLFHNYMFENLLFLNDIKCRYSFFTELSEPHSKTVSEDGPRLHVHGVIQFRSDKAVKEFLLVGYYRLLQIGMLKFDNIDDLTTWYRYCIKQQTITQFPPLENCNEVWEIDDNALSVGSDVSDNESDH